MNKLLAAIIAVSLCSCTANHLVSVRGPETHFAPVNEGRGGTVRYKANRHAQKGRQAAYQAMRQRCLGPYKILNEHAEARAVGSSPDGLGGYYHDTIRFVYIDFECEDHLTSQPSANAN